MHFFPKVTFHSKKHQSNPPKSYSFQPVRKETYQHSTQELYSSTPPQKNISTFFKGQSLQNFQKKQIFSDGTPVRRVAMPWVEPYVFANDRLGGWSDGWMVGWTGRVVVVGLNFNTQKNNHLFKVINGIERKNTFKEQHVVCFFENKHPCVVGEFGFKYTYTYI